MSGLVVAWLGHAERCGVWRAHIRCARVLVVWGRCVCDSLRERFLRIFYF